MYLLNLYKKARFVQTLISWISLNPCTNFVPEHVYTKRYFKIKVMTGILHLFFITYRVPISWMLAVSMHYLLFLPCNSDSENPRKLQEWPWRVNPKIKYNCVKVLKANIFKATCKVKVINYPDEIHAGMDLVSKEIMITQKPINITYVYMFM